MALLKRSRREARPSVRGRRKPRKARASARGDRAPDADRYGVARLGTLYEISKLLTNVVEEVEQTAMPLLAALNKVLPLRSAVLTETTAAQPKTVLWAPPELAPADLSSAEGRAMKSLEILTGAPVRHIPPSPGEPGKFMTCPLTLSGRPVFGVLHLEGVAPFAEADVEFATAVANLLATALDRRQGRRQEVTLRKQAEEHNAFKTSLVSVVSHEVGNSLAVMKMATFLLKEKLPAELLKDSDRLFDMLLGNIELLTRAVKNLLNMGRLEAGKLAINFAPTDAAKLLRDVGTALALPCEQKSLHVSYALPDDLPPLKADSASLSLVVSNLLSNAIKYTPARGDIVLGVTPEPTRPGYFRVYVQDSGIGVSEEERGKILGGHFRAESGKTMTSKGFGVGLSLAQQIIEAHDSTIEIEGGPGKGSRFSFLLPAA